MYACVKSLAQKSYENTNILTDKKGDKTVIAGDGENMTFYRLNLDESDIYFIRRKRLMK